MARSDNNLKSVLQDTANAIRGKTGSSAPITPRDFADEIENIPTGGSSEELEILENTFSGTYSNSNLSTLKRYAFATASNLESVNLPQLMEVAGYAFAWCPNLKNVSLPNASIVREGVFYQCSFLPSINLPNALLFSGVQVFQGCSRLEEASCPKITNPGTSLFQSCSSLRKVYMPLLSVATPGTFQGCKLLSDLTITNCEIIHGNAFIDCYSLSEINLPICSKMQVYSFNSQYGVFGNCSNLKKAVFPVLENVISSAFIYCSSLESAIFLHSSVATLSHQNAFYNTPMSSSSYLGHYGSIYVPASLVESYKSATNWAVYSDRITAATSEMLGEN